MTDAIAPAYPNHGSVDFNAVLANDAAGARGADVFENAITPDKPDEVADAEAPQDRDPRVGDSVSYETLGGGWFAVTATWLAQPIKVQGEEAAEAKADELAATIPAV